MSAYNETTQAVYQGGNILRLLGAEAEYGYDERHGWAGFHQWIQAGRVVRKAEHGVACLTVITVDADDKGRTRTARGFRVFHYDQTISLEDKATDDKTCAAIDNAAAMPGEAGDRDPIGVS